MGWVVNATPRPLYPRERKPVPIVQEAGSAPVPVWKGAENLALTEFDPRIVQSVASGYTDWATPTLSALCICLYEVGRFPFLCLNSHS